MIKTTKAARQPSRNPGGGMNSHGCRGTLTWGGANTGRRQVDPSGVYAQKWKTDSAFLSDYQFSYVAYSAAKQPRPLSAFIAILR